MDEAIESGSIVVGVDGSDDAARALRWAAEQAGLERRRLLVVTAENVRRLDITDRVRERACSIVDAAADEARRIAPGVTVDARFVPGDPRGVLVDLSEAAHLLVLGSRGRGALRSMLLGSVSVAVTRHAACPVVVCRARPREASARGVVVGADGSPESLPVIEFGFAQASLRRMPLTVLHCFWDVGAAIAGYRESAGEILDDPDLEELRVLLSESVAGFSEKYPDVPVSLRLRHGLVDEALSPRRHGWDLIVVGRHPMTSIERFVTGSIATAVVERAHTTVAVVPEGGSSDRLV